MNKSDFLEIINDIKDALSVYDVSVYYHRPCGRGYDSSCGYFEVTIDDYYDWDDIDNSIQWVLDEHDLYIDDESESDFDLNADWDRLD